MGASFLKFTTGFLAIIFVMLASAYFIYLSFSDTQSTQAQTTQQTSAR